MSIRRSIRQIPETLALGLAFCSIPFLPRRVVAWLSRPLGGLAYRCCRRMRIVTHANLDAVFGGLPPEERDRIARRSFRSFALLFLDYFWFALFTRKRIARWLTIDPSMEPFFSTAPCIVVTAHLGNWEILGQAVAIRNCPCVSVVAPLENSFANWFINRVRRITGQQTTPREGAVKRILSALRNGGRTALVMDQNTRPKEGGEYVSFFGLQVPVSKTASALSLRTGAPIMTLYGVSDFKGGYRGCALPALDPVKESMTESEVTQAVTAMMEKIIRDHPDQWLWSYKRWNYIPDGESKTGYPFYSRYESEPRVIF